MMKMSILGSDPSMEEYHRISDETMENLLAYLEEIIYSESSGENGWDVDYDVGIRPTVSLNRPRTIR
jgi:hypothetical protein